ncbi:MAG: DegT/DnrJ/EryC1/StrS family aminotransferase, partial [Bacteroidetes bacterium]|nr:DegT/DnrJ/EryC1/StrS family aminotransferase [Bacteroidota bacterium]
AGSIGVINTFSFYGNKTLTTGEGGMVVTDNDELAARIRLLKGQGMSTTKRYWFEETGFNYRMTNLQAAIGCAQMERIEELVGIKVKNAERYNSLLKDVSGISTQKTLSDCLNTYWMYSILLDGFSSAQRDEFAEKLRGDGIDTRPLFYLMTDMPPFEGGRKDQCVDAEKMANSGLNLPSSTLLTEENITYIAERIRFHKTNI